MSDYKVGDKIELNCPRYVFIHYVHSGRDILKENFKDGVATIAEVLENGELILAEIDNNGDASIAEHELQYVKLADVGDEPLNQTLEQQLANSRSLLKVAGKRIEALEKEVGSLEGTHKLYIIVDSHSGEEAINHDGTPVVIYGSTVTIDDCWGEDCTTTSEDLGEGRFYLEEVYSAN